MCWAAPSRVRGTDTSVAYDTAYTHARGSSFARHRVYSLWRTVVPVRNSAGGGRRRRVDRASCSWSSPARCAYRAGRRILLGTTELTGPGRPTATLAHLGMYAQMPMFKCCKIAHGGQGGPVAGLTRRRRFRRTGQRLNIENLPCAATQGHLPGAQKGGKAGGRGY